MLEEYLKDNTLQSFILTAITAAKKCTVILDYQNFDKVSGALHVGQGHLVMLQGHYARFHTHSYHCCREMHFNLDSM